MTDKEIIKALECCITTNNKHKCIDCPYENVIGFCFDELNKDALALINRQQAEIERLQSILVRFLDEMSEWGDKNNVDTTNFSIIPIAESEKESLVKQLKNEANKEFAERLKEEMRKYCGEITEDDINNLVKEMVGEQS